jgi:ribosomal protein S18 acetylase RimI-like enzyme
MCIRAPGWSALSDRAGAPHGPRAHTRPGSRWGWDEQWQRADFDRRLQAGTAQIITVGGERAGAVEADDRDSDVIISNIQILPSHQRRGIGSRLLRLLIAQASERGRGVSLQVLETNTDARKLYERLGFTVTASAPPHIQMTRPHRIRT